MLLSAAAISGYHAGRRDVSVAYSEEAVSLADTPGMEMTAEGGEWVGLGASYLLRPAFALVALTYVGLLALYSGPLKHVVIIDVLTIAIGFLLRAVAGAVAIDVPISHWLLILTILGALFLALCKRRHELVLLADEATGHRSQAGVRGVQIVAPSSINA